MTATVGNDDTFGDLEHRGPEGRDLESLKGVVAIGASAGGVEALSNLAAGLSPDLPYAYLMVLHVPAGAPSVLARIVDRSGPLPTAAAQDGAPLEPGRIYVGVPDRHLLVADHRVVLSQGPTENGHRPAINALFRSVAVTFGPVRSACCSPACSTTACWEWPRFVPGAASPSASHPMTRCSRPCPSMPGKRG